MSECGGREELKRRVLAEISKEPLSVKEMEQRIGAISGKRLRRMCDDLVDEEEILRGIRPPGRGRRQFEYVYFTHHHMVDIKAGVYGIYVLPREIEKRLITSIEDYFRLLPDDKKYASLQQLAEHTGYPLLEVTNVANSLAPIYGVKIIRIVTA